jgi:hypothetical protein
MIKKILGVGLLLCINSAQLQAGEYAADFIHLGTGADAAAMGGAWSTSKAGATSFYWNPALVLDDQPYKLYLESVDLFDGLSTYQSAALQLRIREYWALSLGGQFQSVADIPRYDALLEEGRDLTDPAQRSNGSVSGNAFDGTGLATTIGLSREFWFDILLGGGLVRNALPARLALGASYRQINQNLDDVKASGGGVDIGIKLMLSEPITAAGQGHKEIILAVSRQNIFSSSLSWDTDSNHSDPLNANTKFGISWSDRFRRVDLGYRIALERDAAYEGAWHFGTEIDYSRLLFLRAGIINNGNDVNSNSAGAGIKLQYFIINYAYVSHDLGPTHRISIEFRM